MFELLESVMRLSVPLIFAAYGALLSERSGVANIALESYLLFSAFAAAAATSLTGSLEIGILAGLAASALTGLLFAFVCLWGRGDQIVVGTGFNLLAAGLLPVLNKALFNVTGATPTLPLSQRLTQPGLFFALAIALLAALWFVLKQTRLGLRLSSAGENPQALSTLGVSVRATRVLAIVIGAVIAGFGGVYLSLCQGSGFVRDMSAGRGFIALAALIFGGWRPVPTVLACLFFALADAAQIQMQGAVIGGLAIPSELVQILPYIATLMVLAFSSRKIIAPAAINQPD